jgi:hypothetical protein
MSRRLKYLSEALFWFMMDLSELGGGDAGARGDGASCPSIAGSVIINWSWHKRLDAYQFRDFVLGNVAG